MYDASNRAIKVELSFFFYLAAAGQNNSSAEHKKETTQHNSRKLNGCQMKELCDLVRSDRRQFLTLGRHKKKLLIPLCF